ncbi:SGNH hydrolase-type esterase domain-containing protein [Zychaea mexicana]|uniref:SGNH hydrolase-type esterase domain-containing protein n=1 Tax=Zychaea mexicana TaxID=64656 RepID=UPI0022FECC38|nr:SGNH hydrolase-type esterase domain-containing protein [Zychaea mexicana]KAI9491886.1 SGNH hydrolase-type esterase domain-containing protein [Zychaea mexicana]
MASQHVYSQVSSFQVLQRDFTTNTALVKQSDGQTLSLEIGGPYTIDNATNVLVGDVWVMSGQSNMRGSAFYTNPWTDPPSTYPEYVDEMVHLFQSNEDWSLCREPTHRLDQSARQVSYSIPDPSVYLKDYHLYRGVSLGTAFSKAYREQYNVPVGLVASSHGGTTMEQWSPELLETTENPFNNTLYGAMLGRIEKIENQVAGILWYQGESDAENATLANEYGTRLKSFIQTTRSKLNNERLPFVYVQIARSSNLVNNNNNWNTVREGQRSLINDDWNTDQIGVVSSIDCELDDPVHLSANGQAAVGRRLAVAAARTLRNVGGSSSPDIDTITFEKHRFSNSTSVAALQATLLLQFNNVDEWREPEGGIFGFSLHDENGAILPVIYKTAIQEDKKSIRLFLSDSAMQFNTNNVFLYYGYGMNPRCNMETSNGMGLLAFGPVPVTLDF